MAIDKKFVDQFINVSSKAALSSSYLVGKKDKFAADKAAVDSMRSELNKMNIQGKIVIGEGELDDAPMLYIGEKLGNGDGPNIDIAVDPVEGTNFVAKSLPGAMSVLAVSEKGNLFNAPETYMEKIAVGNHVPKDTIDLDFSVEKNIKNYSNATSKNPNEITVCLLDRPRHKKIISELIRLNVNIKYISDGDVSGALLVTDKKFGVDLFMGTGGGPEGVIAAAALDNLNCKFQGRFLFKSKEDKIRANKMGISDLNKKYEINEIVKGESIFCATGITSGELMNGIIKKDDRFITETIVGYNKSSLKLVKKEISIT